MAPLIRDIVGAVRCTAATRWQSAKGLRADTRAALARHRAARSVRARSVRETLHLRRSASLASLRAALRPVMGAPALWDLWPAGRSNDDERLPGSVLQVIEQHPEGVGAVEVGNQLGVDWRRVLGIGRELAEDGLVEQLDHQFFPIEKASRRW